MDGYDRTRRFPGPKDHNFWSTNWSEFVYWPQEFLPLQPDERASEVFADPEFQRLGRAYAEACRKANVADAYQIAQEKERDRD